MRRLLAGVMLCVTGLLPVALLFSNGSDAYQVPLCCRTSGKHRCAMTHPHQESTPGIRSICGDWQLSLPATSTAVSPVVILPPSAHLFFAAIVSHPAVQAQTESQFRVSFERSGQKRGPPLSL